MAIFLFVAIGIFAILFGSIPTGFFKASFSSSLGVDKEIAERFALSNITMYGNTGNDTMNYQYTSYNDGKWKAGLPSGHYLEVIWGDTGEYIFPYGKSLELRHIKENLFWVDLIHRLELTPSVYVGEYSIEVAKTHYIYSPAQLEETWSNEANGSVWFAECGHIQTSIIFEYDQATYDNITHAWNSGVLGYTLSYEVDWNATGISALTVVGQLLTFQNPDLGIEGEGGMIFNAFVAFPFWIVTAILIIKLVQSIIPFISGVDE